MSEGKIIKALSGFYYVLEGENIIRCRGRGVFRKKNVTPLVGDYVVFQSENETEGYIMEIKPRKNELIRPPIANIDQAILVFSAARPDFSPLLLDRFLSVIEANDITPVICITKMDLLSEEEKKKIGWYIDGYQSIGYEVFQLSTKTGDGLKQLFPFIDGKISVLAGQSGVGKSSLLNSLHPQLDIKTADISDHLGRGKHTTRHVELLQIGGGLVADTPGFSSLEFPEMEAEDLPFTFPEIEQYGENCKFRGCLHINEPGCAVKQAVESGEIRQYRYDHYQDFYQEIKNRKPRY
ncbi:ribosome small subunit-dependent GTPase A [Siminovitchia fortis]|uniref:Small ribosomal subunit biogenesis GTPase RsgA n=1 Tax=Siminovitchia fortis TaxID=254758 RepID=A0A443J1B9_9BACI|nr:ribosome small subunit-dependent GTPase A [Siminovitchia fortis]RWR14190.1 ribosome small subunit-dependent GTPase A [Siminovitchia fortis]WHY83700.1 ribosome small subunit-dependent GTPase A [Siminovitchia fortis]